jgi:hypothetical protein
MDKILILQFGSRTSGKPKTSKGATIAISGGLTHFLPKMTGLHVLLHVISDELQPHPTSTASQRQ